MKFNDALASQQLGFIQQYPKTHIFLEAELLQAWSCRCPEGVDVNTRSVDGARVLNPAVRSWPRVVLSFFVLVYSPNCSDVFVSNVHFLAKLSEWLQSWSPS